MEFIFINLPKEFIYEIIQFIPKFGLTPEILYNQQLFLKWRKTIQKINLESEETKQVLKDLKDFNFVKGNYYTFEGVNFFLTLYFSEPEYESDYVVIYF